MATRWIDALERRFGKWHQPGLAAFLVGMNAAVAIFTLLKPEFPARLMLDPGAVLQGEFWRLATFLFVPPAMEPMWAIFWLIMLFSILKALESAWGDFRFNLYCALGAVCVGAYALLRGMTAPNTALMTSFFLAFAHLFPDVEVLIFFILPVKVRWIGLAAWAWLGVQCLFGGWEMGIYVFASLGNYLAFFGPDHWLDLKYYWRRRKLG